MPILFVSFLVGTAIGISGFFAAVKTELITDAHVTKVEVQEVKEEHEVLSGATPEEQKSPEAEPAVASATTESSEKEESEESVTPTETPTPSLTLTPSVSPSVTQTITPTVTETVTLTPTTTETPTPTPTIKPITAPAHLEPHFQKYSSLYGADINLLKKIADCESHFNNNAIALEGTYVGMFQFSASSWSSVRRQMGLDPNPDLRYGAEESIQTAAFAISKGKASMWPSCSK